MNFDTRKTEQSIIFCNFINLGKFAKPTPKIVGLKCNGMPSVDTETNLRTRD